MQPIAIFIESKEHAVKEAVWGAFAAAEGAGNMYALVPDGAEPAMRDELAQHGATTIVTLCGPTGAPLPPHPDAVAGAVANAMRELGVEVLLGLTSAQGTDLLPRVAALLDAPLLMDCVAVDLSEQTVCKSHFAGRAWATIRWETMPCVIGIRPNAIPPAPAPTTPEQRTIEWAAEPDTRWVCKEILAPDQRDEVELTEADIVVSGGRPMGNWENYQILFAFAREVGGAVGASRAAVDAGYAPHDLQVGQTGKTVSPRLYIACGISGAVQHLAGMRTAEVVVAINQDPGAPIFGISTYGIVGDLFDVVPALTAAIREWKSNSERQGES